MADVPKVGEISAEGLGEYDDRSLDIILTDYAKEETPRLGLTPFRNTYLPVLARKHPRPEDQAAVRRMWIAEVAKSNRYPVFIVDDSDSEKILYRVPPLIGTVHTGLTGHEESMNSMDQKEQEYKDRLSSMGARVREQKFNMFGATSVVNRVFQLDWIRILADFGYLAELKEVLGEGPYPEDVAEIIGDKLQGDVSNKEEDLKSPAATGVPIIGLASEEEYEQEDF